MTNIILILGNCELYEIGRTIIDEKYTAYCTSMEYSIPFSKTRDRDILGTLF